MAALQRGRVIVLLSRGPPGEVNVYFCALTCVFKEAAHAGQANCVKRKCGTTRSVLLLLPDTTVFEQLYILALTCYYLFH